MIAAYLAIVCLAALLAYREHIHYAERRELYQRIQSPEKAVIDYAPPKAVLEPDDNLVPFDPGMWGPPIPDEVA